MRSRSPLAILDNIGRAQSVWALFGGVAMVILTAIWDYPLPMVLFVGLGSVAFLLIIFHRLHLWWSQRQIVKPERFEALGHALNALRDATLAAPIIDWKASSGADFERASSQMEVYRTAYEDARRATSILEYDRDTWIIANDYRHLCSMIFMDAQLADQSNEYRGMLYAMHSPVMQMLSNGQRIIRGKVPRPEWMKENE